MTSETKSCPNCGAAFLLNQPHKRFCSKACRVKHHNDMNVWALRADRERHNARKKARYADDPEGGARKMREWRAKNPEKQDAIDRRRYEKDREKKNARCREWHHKNRERVNAKRLDRHHQNKDAANARRREHYHTHKEENRAMRREKFYEARVVSPWLSILKAAKSRATKRGIVFDLTPEWIEQRWTGRCEITGLSFRIGTKVSGPKSFSPSIDRIDTTRGYAQDNCRIILWAVNALKADGSDDDMYLVAEAVTKSKTPLNSDT